MANTFFLSIGMETSQVRSWGRHIEHFHTVSLPNIDSLSPRPKYLPQAVPEDLATQLMTFHGYPFIWFIGQFVRYLMRPNMELQKYISNKREAMGLKHPIVG